MHYSFRQKWKTGTERQYSTDIIGLSSTTVISASKSVKSGEKCKMKAIKAFKVIEVGTNQKLLCEFLLVINSNWHPISYRFGVIAAYCSNFGHCVLEPPFGGLGTTYDIHLGLIGKRVVDFLSVLTELFSLRLNDLSYGIKIWTDLSSVLSQSMCLTDRQMDGQTAFSSLDVCIPCSAVQTRFWPNQNFGLRLKLRIESIGSAND